LSIEMEMLEKEKVTSHYWEGKKNKNVNFR